MEIENFIKSKIFEITFKNVSSSEPLITSALIDSITMVELIVEIEEFLGKQVPQHLIIDENFNTVEKILETISKCDAQ